MNKDDSFFDQLIQQNSKIIESEMDDGKETEESPLVDESTTVSTDIESPPTSRQGMPPDAKRAMVSLLRQGVLLMSQKSKLFETICRYQDDVRRHLSDMYLNLVIDEKSGVAFVASLNQEDLSDSETITADTHEESISLITRRTLTLFDTLLLLVLRKYYQEREISGEQKVVIDVERIDSNMTPFLTLTNNSKSDRKKLDAALQRMIAKRILSSVRGSDDRYEITPIIRYVVNAEFLENLLSEYHRLASESNAQIEQEVQ